ncbi:epidermal retinol dehydrogenase 2 isoform X1 [Octopus sinensis]|uniref:Epidermal retinol dehydrogenase 2 isoform X1 n=1 Tax=Octopus sinensis TaxID=2607531 RepID=A0A6P7SB76_9MOLL|nr:epidermal retinol dehydrogenase 2 isoform X1 [Octopus sinensis]XP_029635640.1 epidermal retinol dehydrogenase 2 isoform X1 [Octopus sinensis]XP_029635641.1 epidermal retinol dehydrogenase 2 isoform X1 [Octopus sinensis]XP_029635643.1 epidermal retinol dehydrogenase 2 isoform X1 [Octopus sinensis]XP_036358501.1 epidermal retinol dehydrogenase 2 isoform X1 [Octopus sinensis]XP_036358502.1 epidermal retinol dehydrogenase 2 isoform X1 [Octopus sinensis]
MIDWDFVKEIILTILAFYYYLLDGIIRAILPGCFYAKDVAGETVLITGSGSGIGRELALRFAKLGCRMVLWDVNVPGNDATAKAIKELGGSCYQYKVDLGNKDEIYETARKVNEDIGMVHILINNAGIVTGRKFLECPDELIEKTIDVNTMAHFWTVKAFLPAMIKENHGHVVTVASAAGLLGVNSLTDYCASKFAVVGFEESLRFELEVLGKDGVHTTVVCPFYINTGMFNGVKVRFPYLMPILEPGYVSDKIVEAVRCNTHILYIPRLLYYTLGLKGILPHKCISLLARFFGVSTDMEKFKGKLGQKKE